MFGNNNFPQIFALKTVSSPKLITEDMDMICFMFQCQDVYPELMEDLQKLVASPMVTENEFPSTFLSGKFYNELELAILSFQS